MPPMWPLGTLLEMTALAPIADRLGKFIRLLSSDKDGEVVAAARAIIRTLHSEKLDIHVLADGITDPNGHNGRDREYTEDDMVAAHPSGPDHRREDAQRNGG